MKRIFSVLIIVVMACFAFTGCVDDSQVAGNSSENTMHTSSFKSSEQSTPEQPTSEQYPQEQPSSEQSTTGESATEKPKPDQPIENNKIFITIGETVLTATLVENSATKELKERLKTSPITIEMNDYGGWEKVGNFGFNLPTSNSQITAQPCEFVLYQGNQLVIFYGSNSWSYTSLGKIDNITQAELKEILGTGDVTVTLSLNKLA